MFRAIIRYSNKRFGLLKRLKEVTDKRIKAQISTAEVAVAIFSLQIANQGSLHNFSQSVKTPSVSTIARSADTMDLDKIREVGLEIYKKARKSKMLTPYLSQLIGIVDGKEITTSQYCKCGHCKRRKLKDKDGKLKYQYYHQVTVFILATNDFSFTLDIEPILPGEGEVRSSYRLIERVLANYPKAFSIIIGDGLYLNGKIFKLLKTHHKKTIAVLKEERRQLFSEANKLSLLAEPQVYRQGKTTYRVWDHAISGCWEGYGDDVRVIVSEEVTRKRVHAKDGGGWEDIEEVANWMWVTNMVKDGKDLGDLKNMVRLCHSRWHIENRCFRETASMWNMEHIYRHSENAIMVFLLFLSMALNIFNIFRKRNVKDKKIKTKLKLMQHIRADFTITPSPLPPIPI